LIAEVRIARTQGHAGLLKSLKTEILVPPPRKLSAQTDISLGGANSIKPLLMPFA
jgi:hypothetical protein